VVVTKSPARTTRFPESEIRGLWGGHLAADRLSSGSSRPEGRLRARLPAHMGRRIRQHYRALRLAGAFFFALAAAFFFAGAAATLAGFKSQNSYAS
jgi:hypothetical protein